MTPVPGPPVTGLPFDHPATRWIIAAQLIMRLDHFTFTDISTETE
ncbi:hypothetical protein [Streptomyces specialis]|nr:hypothetical protein [Streptomyces specialis]